MADLLKMWPNVEERRARWYFPCKGCCNDGISELFVGGVHKMRHGTETHFDTVRCFRNYRRDVDDQQQIRHLRAHNLEDNAWRRDVLVPEEGHNKLTDIPETRTFIWVVRTAVPVYRKLCACWVPKKLIDIYKVHRIRLYTFRRSRAEIYSVYRCMGQNRS
jgi:hypothetical protein